MQAEFTNLISNYGYLAIFLMVFLQELGVPNPITNEFVLLFSGYLTSIDKLNFFLVFLSAVSADFIGTSILFFIFYFFGKRVLGNKPKWLPIKQESIEKLSNSISNHGWWGIYVGRLIPYVRGYVSVASGLLQIKPKTFILTVILSAITWTGGYVTIGHFLGEYWEKFAVSINNTKVIFIVLGIIILIFFGFRLRKTIINHFNHQNQAK